MNAVLGELARARAARKLAAATPPDPSPPDLSPQKPMPQRPPQQPAEQSARTRLVCHGALNDIGSVACASLGGFGDADAEEEADVEQPVDFVALGEQQPVQVLDEEDAKQEDVEEQKEQEEEQLPEVLATHFASKATRSGRAPKKKKIHDAG